MALRADDRFRFDADGMLVEVTHHGTTSGIQLVGECDLAQQETLRASVLEVFTVGPEHIVLDLSDLTFIDSTGIHFVIELHKRARRQGVRLVICPSSRQVQRIFDLCGLTARLPFLPAVDSSRGSRGTPQWHT